MYTVTIAENNSMAYVVLRSLLAFPFAEQNRRRRAGDAYKIATHQQPNANANNWEIVNARLKGEGNKRFPVLVNVELFQRKRLLKHEPMNEYEIRTDGNQKTKGSISQCIITESGV